MPRAVRRHVLLVYTLMIDRWWKATLAIGIVLLIIAGGLGVLPVWFPGQHFPWVEDWRLWAAGGAGGVAIAFTLFLVAIRKQARVQVFSDHLRIITPFLRLNIAYRRLRRSATSEFQQAFPPNSMSKWRREIIRPLAKYNVILLELTGWPMPRGILHFFLSPFFFPDKTPRLSLLVPDWLAFSTELDSAFTAWQDRGRQVSSTSNRPQPRR